LQPSEEDIRLTRKLVEGGRMLDILVQDHIIVTANGFYSFADNGQMH
jgi:DNA repair protein RadC